MITKMVEQLMHYTWDLAYFQLDNNPLMEFDPNLVHIVKNPFKNKWFADPFILNFKDNMLELLVEEYDSEVKRGRIARIEIDTQKDIIVDCHIVLDLPTHLSFPAIYRHNGKIYVTPENSASGAFYAYEYDKESDKLINRQLLQNEPLTDAIIDQQDGKYRMYATSLPTPNGNCLNIYEANNFWGPYYKHSTVLFENNTARMAGYMIHEKGKIIRPAQDCNNGYGEAVILFEGEKELTRITPPFLKYKGLHTFNSYSGYGVIDLKIYDHFILVRLKDIINGMFT